MPRERQCEPRAQPCRNHGHLLCYLRRHARGYRQRRPDRGRNMAARIPRVLSLRTLAVAGDGMLDAVWAGLLRATTAAVQRDRAVCCPLLFEIATDNDPSSHSSSSFQRPRRCSWRYARPWAQVSMLARPALKSLSCPLAIPEPNDGQTETLHHDRDHIVLEDVKMLVGELDYRELQAL